MTWQFLISSGRLALLLTTQIVITLVVFIAIVASIVFSVRRPLRRYKPLDLAVFDSLKHLPNPRRNSVVLAVTYLGKHQFLIPANLILIFFFLFIAKETWLSVRVLSVSLSSLVLILLLKWLFKRKRPLSPLLEAARGLSFPSGHAIMSVSFFGQLIYLIAQLALPQLVGTLLILVLVLIIIAIGFSRIYLRVHYASDVLAGFIIGLIWLMISLTVVEKVHAYML